MGAALTALAARYPRRDPAASSPTLATSALAARNVARYGERCTVVEAGIWDSDVELSSTAPSKYGEHGFRVRERAEADPPDMTGISAL